MLPKILGVVLEELVAAMHARALARLEAALALRIGKVEPGQRYDIWRSIVERIYREQVNQAWSHYLFRLVRAIFDTNQTLSAEGGFLFRWMVANYVDSALMLVRRELDRQDGTENLRNLLFDMIEHPTVITRERYRASTKDGSGDRWFADRVFDRFEPIRVAENRDADHLNPDVVKADLDRIETSAERLREYAERTRAHRTPERGLDRTGMTFAALHGAIADVRSVIAKYYALLTLRSVAQWEPVPQYDVFEAFTKPWLIDRATVTQAAKESTGG